MKKRIIVAMVALSVFAAQAPKANASVFLIGSGGYVGLIGQGDTPLEILAGSLTVVGLGAFVAGLAVHPLFLVLNADGSLNQSSLEKVISEKYSSIEDKNVVSALASEIKARADSEEFVDGKKMVSVDEETVRSILDQADVSEETVQQVVADLK